MAAAAKCAPAAGISRSPYVQCMQDDRASILWTSDQPGEGSVSISADGANWQTANASMRIFDRAETQLSASFYQFQADFTGLYPGTRYWYRVAVDGWEAAAGDNFTFRTAAPEAFRFLVMGDGGSHSTEEFQISGRMAAEQDIDLAVHVGDLAYNSGTFAQYDANYFAPNAALMRRVPVYAAPGNHDYYTAGAAAYFGGHVFPDNGGPTSDAGRYYSFDWSDAHFVSLDSNWLLDPESDRMLDWLDADLRRTRKYWKIVFFHHAPYTSGHHIADPVCAAAREKVVPIVERHAVQLVLGGHEHSYQRTLPLQGGVPAAEGNGTVYVITAGGGAGLHDISVLPTTAMALQMFHYLRVEVSGRQLAVRAIGLDGGEIDRFSLAPAPVLRAVVNAGDFSPAMAAGSLASLFGRNLGVRDTACSGLPLPVELGGVRVAINGEPAPLYFVSPGQVNCQIPFETKGSATVEVTTENGTSSAEITVAEAAPAVFAITSPAGLVSPRNPAQAGRPITIYLTGLGPVAGGLRTGEAAPPATRTLGQVRVNIGEATAEPSFAGLAPGFAGLYQVNVTVPAGLPGGNYGLQVWEGAAGSQAILLPVAGQ